MNSDILGENICFICDRQRANGSIYKESLQINEKVKNSIEKRGGIETQTT